MVRVASIQARDLSLAVRLALDSLGDRVRSALSGARVLIKANFNSPHRYPASSDPAFLVALADALKRAGVTELGLGDSCGLRWAPARAVFDALDVPGLAKRMEATCIDFDAGKHRTVAVGTEHVDAVDVADAAFTWDKIVYACCMKTHRAARFSLSLKHTIGFLSKRDRSRIHDTHIEERVAEINKAVTPDIVFVDARKCFVSGGPAKGRVRKPGVILASTDRVALDVEGLKILSSFFAFNRLLRDPWKHTQIRKAVDLELGVGSEGEYEVIHG